MASLVPSIGDPDGTCFTVLPKTLVIGLSVTTLVGAMSTSMVLILLGLVARSYIRNVKDPPPGGEWRLIRTHVDAYMLSLLCSEILQGIGATMNAKWVIEGTLYCSDYCSVQGALKAIGESGVAMSTLAIAVHTFIVIFFWWIPSPRSAWIYRIVILFIWVYPTLFVVVASVKHHDYNSTDPDAFFSPVPYWCWISAGDVEQIFGEYFWLWIALGSSVTLYTLLFFRLRGNIQVDRQNWKRIGVKLHPDSHMQPTAASREAMAMIWYPICYTILVLPLSFMRWVAFRDPEHSELEQGVAVFAITMFALSGSVSVVLILLTRRNLLLLGPNRGIVNSASRY